MFAVFGGSRDSIYPLYPGRKSIAKDSGFERELEPGPGALLPSQCPRTGSSRLPATLKRVYRGHASRIVKFLARQDGGIDLVIHAAGMLHGDGIQPEKSIGQCQPQTLERLFRVNSIGPLMVARALLAAQARKRRFAFAAVSAMVGSIGDNRRGGWYGYRASKAALNQFMHTLAIECRVRYPEAVIVAAHPGTTDTDLSRPFQRHLDPGKLYTPRQTAERILRLASGLGLADSGRFFNWDGTEIPW